MRFAVEQWSPDYDAPFAVPEGQPAAEVDVTVERAAKEWAPIQPTAEPADSILFVDGVQRIDARIWVDTGEGQVRGGLCASIATGVVRCTGQAEVEDARVQRLFVAPQPPGGVATRHGSYDPVAAVDDSNPSLTTAMEDQRRSAEIEITRDVSPADLVVLDGALWQRGNVEHAVGYLKTHQVAYLSGDQQAVVGALRPGQRTPLFLVKTSWSRYSWYVRLPSPPPEARTSPNR